MPNQGLLFIPDISGFSRFVNQTEIDHSRLIIQELLESLIEANEIGLEVSEVEGDAILFYRFGERPTLEELYRQVERMFCSFHSRLGAYDIRKYCQCDACLAAKDLTLKVISHYGEFTGYSVTSFNKLIGRDVIVAHELLKNDIDKHEYWLVSHTLAPDGELDVPADWMEWMAGAKQTQAGEVAFHYAQLGKLKDTVPPTAPPSVDLERGTRVLSMSRVYDVDMVTLFHACGDFDYRARWQAGVVTVEQVDHLLPRVGMRCRCVMENGETRSFTSTYYSWGGERIEFVERVEETDELTRYVLEKVDEDRTRLTVELYLMGGLASQLRFRFGRRRDEEQALTTSLDKLTDVVRELRIARSA